MFSAKDRVLITELVESSLNYLSGVRVMRCSTYHFLLFTVWTNINRFCYSRNDLRWVLSAESLLSDAKWKTTTLLGQAAVFHPTDPLHWWSTVTIHLIVHIEISWRCKNSFIIFTVPQSVLRRVRYVSAFEAQLRAQCLPLECLQLSASSSSTDPPLRPPSFSPVISLRHPPEPPSRSTDLIVTFHLFTKYYRVLSLYSTCYQQQWT